jgi:hypothetical protein
MISNRMLLVCHAVVRMALASGLTACTLSAQVPLPSGAAVPISISGLAICTAIPPNYCVVWGDPYYIDVAADVTQMTTTVEQSSGPQLRVYGRLGSSPTIGGGIILADFGAVSGNPHTLTRNLGLATGRYYFRSAITIYATQTVNVSGSLTVTTQTTALTYSLGGTIRDQSNNPVSGVQANLTGGAVNSATTGAAGSFTFSNLTGGLSYTVTPSKPACTFSPPSRTFDGLSSNQLGDFTANCAPAGFSISGQVRDGGNNPISGVLMSISSGSSNTSTGASGDYSFGPLTVGQSYTVTPSKAGCSFTPASRTHSNLSADQTAQNFTAACASLSGLRFVPVTPCRLVDTRLNLGAFGQPSMTANTSRSFAIPQANCGIPADARAYSLNITVVPKEPLGFLTVWPTGTPQPFVSTLNSSDGRIKANAAIVPAGPGGAISVFATNATELVIDIGGYFIEPQLNPQGLVFYPLTPCRVVDTRNVNGSLGGPVIGAGTSRSFPVLASNCGVPANAQAYSLNATVVPSGSLGFLTLWPTGSAQPFVSTLNALTGAVVANAAIVPAGSNGSVSAFVTNQTHLVLDINGYFAPSGAANAQHFYPVTPCRLLDTRGATGEFGGPVLSGNQVRSYRLPLASCNLPGSAAAFSLNATVVPTNTLGFLTLWPAGAAQPFVSTLNAFGDPIVANAAIVPAGTAGGVSSFVTDQTHLILDTNGYFAP